VRHQDPLQRIEAPSLEQLRPQRRALETPHQQRRLKIEPHVEMRNFAIYTDRES
jgi:hypothetical protein